MKSNSLYLYLLILDHKSISVCYSYSGTFFMLNVIHKENELMWAKVVVVACTKGNKNSKCNKLALQYFFSLSFHLYIFLSKSSFLFPLFTPDFHNFGFVLRYILSTCAYWNISIIYFITFALQGKALHASKLTVSLSEFNRTI